MKAILLLLLPLLIIFLFNQKEILTTHSRKFSCKTTQTKCKSNRRKTVITGTIYDCETRLPLALATYKISSNMFYTDSLKKNGQFFKEILPGNYTVVFGWPTYAYQKIPIQLRKGDSLHISVYLKTAKPIAD